MSYIIYLSYTCTLFFFPTISSSPVCIVYEESSGLNGTSSSDLDIETSVYDILEKDIVNMKSIGRGLICIIKIN